MTTVSLILVVGAGGALGSLARYGIEIGVRHRFGDTVPWWGFIVNTSGAFALGCISGWTLHHGANRYLVAALTTGFIGAYTMLAPISVDGPRLWRAGHRSYAALVTIGGYGIALGAATLGLWVSGGR